MGVSSSKLEPHELISFKKLSTQRLLDDIEIPERPESRSPTNTKWLIVLGVFVIVLLPFMIYTLCYSDINRWKGYDKCGNICGQSNNNLDNLQCTGYSGNDMTLKPYVEYIHYDGYSVRFGEIECVSSCLSGYVPISGVCTKYRGQDMELEHLGLYLESVKWQIIISCLLSILVAMGVLFLFRYAIEYVVWGLLLTCFTGAIIYVVRFWYQVSKPVFQQLPPNIRQNYIILGIVFSVITVVLGVILIACRKKIKLVIMLLKEATKAIFDMPGLITVQLICLLVVTFLAMLFGVTTFYMLTAGTLKKHYDVYDYVADPVMIFAMIYNSLVYLWLANCFAGIQYMIIAGAVSKWYFARDKNMLGSPILTSASIAIRYHLGTAVLGGLIITIVGVIKSIILGIINNFRMRAVVQRCVEAIERFFQFLSENAYIMTAIHGQPFIKSGRRGAKLIIQNISDIIAINSIGGFILGMIKLLIVGITLLLTKAILTVAPGSNGINSNVLTCYFIIAGFSFLVAHVTFGLFQTTVDTLFISYCEDNLLNNGMSRPYCMSRNMKEFIQSSKEEYKKK